jgi:hypothetical protein
MRNPCRQAARVPLESPTSGTRGKRRHLIHVSNFKLQNAPATDLTFQHHDSLLTEITEIDKGYDSRTIN